jgi:TetR/AcrR family transcriptional regulator
MHRMTEPASRRWGDDRALLDDDEARGLLLEAAARCITRRGNAQVRMAEVADEAGVVRSTVYRYFATRDELLLGLLLRRTEVALADFVDGLVAPADAASTIPELILGPISRVDGNPLNEALFATESTSVTSAVQAGAEPVVDVLMRHFGPLLQDWLADGQLRPDLDLRVTVHWMNSVSHYLLAPPWRQQPQAAKREFVEQYVVRALLA